MGTLMRHPCCGGDAPTPIPQKLLDKALAAKRKRIYDRLAQGEESAMVQQPRQEQPQYCCIVPVDSLTQRSDEEIMAFGTSEEEAKNTAKQLLVSQYGCTDEGSTHLIHDSRIERLSPWCASSREQD
jgi:hypothetical protein